MAVAIQSQANTNFAASSSTTITKPSGFTTGEVLIAVITMQQQSVSTPDFIVPTGWTSGRQDFFLSGGTYQGIINSYWKAYDPAVDASATNYTFTTGNTIIGMGGCLLRMSGASTIMPISFSNGSQGQSSNTFSINASLTPIANSVLIMAVTTGQTNLDSSTNITSFAIATDNPTWTRQASLNGYPAVGSTAAIATAPRTQATATGNSSGAMAGSYTNPVQFALQLLAISPPAAATLSETITLTEPTVGIVVKIFLQETISLIERLTRPFSTIWQNAVKNISTWLDQTKH